MQQVLIGLVAYLCLVGPIGRAEQVKLGSYSGRVGYYVNIGNEFQSHMDAVLMSDEVYKKVRTLKFEKLGDEKLCEVDGLQQSIGYTIFKIQSCK